MCLEYGRKLEVAVKREMNSDLRRLMRILLTTEREETQVNISQAHKEAQVRTTLILFSLDQSSVRSPVGQSCLNEYSLSERKP
jgi:hypothetical protein